MRAAERTWARRTRSATERLSSEVSPSASAAGVSCQRATSPRRPAMATCLSPAQNTAAAPGVPQRRRHGSAGRGFPPLRHSGLVLCSQQVAIGAELRLGDRVVLLCACGHLVAALHPPHRNCVIATQSEHLICIWTECNLA